MKKVFLALAAVAAVACMTSCAKHCECNTYLNGNIINTNETELTDNFTKDDCNKLTAVVGDGSSKTGIECNATL